ncbi:MAG: hypothetical protein ACRDSZ_08780 [Pseudonocardiaceae bacterium]
MRTFRDAGGGDKPAQGGMSAQTLPAPRDFEAVGELVTEEMVASTVACGPDPRRHLGMVGKHIDAGFDEIYVHQIGPDQEAFFESWASEVLPQLR